MIVSIEFSVALPIFICIIVVDVHDSFVLSNFKRYAFEFSKYGYSSTFTINWVVEKIFPSFPLTSPWVLVSGDEVEIVVSVKLKIFVVPFVGSVLFSIDYTNSKGVKDSWLQI